MLPSNEPGPRRCLLALTPSVVRDFSRSCLLDPECQLLEGRAICFISPTFPALGTMSILDVKYINIM